MFHRWHIFITENFPIKTFSGQASLVHAYNPSYSGGRDQEDCSSKPSQASGFQALISKTKKSQKGLVECLKV
jgi:hypothetical protein